LIYDLAVAVHHVTELAARARSLDVTFAGACGEVKSIGVLAITNATAISGCLVPDFVVITCMRQRLAQTVAVVDVEVSVGTLFVRARL
jgi:hypothetical protein